METDRPQEKLLKLLLKDPFTMHTATSIAKSLNITRQGTWKILNKLREDDLINLKPLSKARTSTTLIKLNWSNPVTEKTLSLILTMECLKQQRWRVNFEDLENKTHFLILFGSILNKPKEANDIDILAITDKKNFKEIEEIRMKIQKTQLKKIHLIDLTKEEFSQELKKHNKAHMEAVKKGIILYGQDNFIQFIRNLKNEH
ncbi:nucleotidyltransferase domain-containing protein [Candidatus Woesearchaeota archaeon]|nr:nucleotidyltransferase domain-containing protein [Candidatus Woesearchaeota archaeon]